MSVLVRHYMIGFRPLSCRWIISYSIPWVRFFTPNSVCRGAVGVFVIDFGVDTGQECRAGGAICDQTFGWIFADESDRCGDWYGNGDRLAIRGGFDEVRDDGDRNVYESARFNPMAD